MNSVQLEVDDELDVTFLDEVDKLINKAITSQNPITTASSPAASAHIYQDSLLSLNPAPSTLQSEGAFSSRKPAWGIPVKEQSFATTRTVSCYGDNVGFVECGRGFSPPRELSQRFPEIPGPSHAEVHDCASRSSHGMEKEMEKEKEIERLKREIRRVSKQLNKMEHECLELQKDKAKKDAQLKSTFSQLEAKDAELKMLKMSKLENPKPGLFLTSPQLHIADVSTTQVCHVGPVSEGKCISVTGRQTGEERNTVSDGKSKKGIEQRREHTLNGQHPRNLDTKNKKVQTNGHFQLQCAKAIGIQTDLRSDCKKDDLLLPCDVSCKLFAIWGTPSNTISGRSLISKLFATCSADFCVIFSCAGISCELNLDTMDYEDSSNANIDFHIHSVQSASVAKVSRFYVILTKISKEMAEMEDLLDALVDMCMLENVLIVQRSLRILRAALQILLSCELRSLKRDNIILAQPDNSTLEENRTEPMERSTEFSDYSFANKSCSTHQHHQHMWKNEMQIKNNVYIPINCLVSLIKSMLVVVERITDEHIQVEALSIITLIVMGSDPSSEREKFGLLLLENLPKLLHRKAGIHVQREALQLLFLLLNCTELLMMFCSRCKDVINGAEASDDQKCISSEVIKQILEGLAVCLTRRGNSIMELKLQKKAIIVLAFVASLGNSGFEALFISVTPQHTNFLELIIQMLAFEIDEKPGGSDAEDLVKERFALMREALILLNRLGSNASYSKVVLRVLTKSNASASLAIDVANMISRRGKDTWKNNGSKSLQVIEAEIIDLARSFRARVLSFMGENIS